MPRRAARRRSIKPWIVFDLDLPAEGAETATLIERDRARVIVGAGVQPEPRDWTRPGKLQCAVHQPAAGAAADQLFGDAEEDDFAVAGFAKIQLQQALAAPLMLQSMDFHQRR